MYICGYFGDQVVCISDKGRVIFRESTEVVQSQGGVSLVVRLEIVTDQKGREPEEYLL